MLYFSLCLFVCSVPLWFNVLFINSLLVVLIVIPKLLRMLGFDTLYNIAFSNESLVNIALEQHRVLLSRNAFIGRHYPLLLTFCISHDEPAVQLKEVLQHFQLAQHIQPFSRCMVCNGRLEPVSKETILNELPEKTAIYYHEFWQCTNCRRIYWKGPHYNRMMRFIANIAGDAGQ